MWSGEIGNGTEKWEKDLERSTQWEDSETYDSRELQDSGWLFRIGLRGEFRNDTYYAHSRAMTRDAHEEEVIEAEAEEEEKTQIY